MKILVIKGCKECRFAKFTEWDLFCKLITLPCGKGFYRRKSLRLLKNHPDWCPLENMPNQSIEQEGV